VHKHALAQREAAARQQGASDETIQSEVRLLPLLAGAIVAGCCCGTVCETRSAAAQCLQPCLLPGCCKANMLAFMQLLFKRPGAPLPPPQILAPKEDDPQPLTEEEIAGAVGPKAMLTWHSDGASQLRMLPMLHTLCFCCSVGRAHPHSRPAATARSCPAAERDTLLQQGFSNWMRRDFNAFVRAVS